MFTTKDSIFLYLLSNFPFWIVTFLWPIHMAFTFLRLVLFACTEQSEAYHDKSVFSDTDIFFAF